MKITLPSGTTIEVSGDEIPPTLMALADALTMMDGETVVAHLPDDDDDPDLPTEVFLTKTLMPFFSALRKNPKGMTIHELAAACQVDVSSASNSVYRLRVPLPLCTPLGVDGKYRLTAVGRSVTAHLSPARMASLNNRKLGWGRWLDQ